jgi:hypothetical protein
MFIVLMAKSKCDRKKERYFLFNVSVRIKTNCCLTPCGQCYGYTDNIVPNWWGHNDDPCCTGCL